MNLDRAETLNLLKAIVVAAALLPLLTFAGASWYLHAQAVASAGFRVERAARIGEEHALKVLENSATLLSRTLDLIGDEPDTELPALEAALHAQLSRMTQGLPQMQGIYVIDSAGRLVATDRRFPVRRDIDLSDRPSFAHHRSNGPQPHVSNLLTSRSTGELFFDLSVRRSHRDGRFGGVLSASMAPSYFANFYREVAGNDSELNIALVRADGAVLARWPDPPAASDVNGLPPTHMKIGPTSGAIRAEAGTLPDGETGLLASRQLGGYPVHVASWIDDEAIRSVWLHQSALLALLMIPVTLGLVLSARVALLRTRRSLQAAEDLRAEIRQREQVEETLRQAQKLEAMGRLTGGVAHDFNNLLMIVSNNLYLIGRQHPQLQGSKPLASMERAVASGAKLTRQLLSFSRRQPFRPEIVTLQERLPLIVELIRAALGSQIRVGADVQAGTPSIEVDVAELELAVLNLAINAKDAMPGGGQLSIAAGAVDAPPGFAGPFVRLTVADEGQGISAAHLQRVFEPFFTTKPPGHGTGLGLSQAYGFCQRAGGVAVVESTEGQGTSVHLYFPASSTAQGAAGDDHVQPQKRLDLRILLAEDNAEVAEATRGALQTLRCSVHHVLSGDDAKRALEADAGRYDALLSDIVMPGTLNGVALARYVRSAFPALAIVLMSGYSDRIDEASALLLDVVPKPCTPDVLAAALEKAAAEAKGDRPAS